MLDNAITLLTLRGIDIRVTPTWLLIALIVVVGLFPRFVEGGQSPVVAGTMAVAGALAFFLSILAHELGHALEAQRRGVTVAGITLFLFGGVTEMHMEAEQPRDEFAVAAIGPYVSFVLAASLGLLVVSIESSRLAGPLAPVAEVAGVIGWLNVMLAVFNLIPGAPLDGGRVLRSLVWAVTADRARAMRLAARFGQAIALLLVPATWVVFVWAFSRPPRLPDLLWLGFIGWFMWGAARQEIGQADLHDALGDRTVGDLEVPLLPALGTDVPLDMAATAFADVARDVTVLPVTDGAGGLTGLLTRPDVDEVAPPDRTFRTVADVMRPLDDLPWVDAAEHALTGLREFARSGTDVLVERRAGEPTRLLTESQLAAALRRLDDGLPVAAVTSGGHDQPPQGR